jgi:ubiquinone biosynthesis O-methyltransferase
MKDGSKREFDVVASMDVIEHVDHPQIFLGELTKVVKAGGTMILSTIARNPLTWLTHILMAEYVTGLVPKHTHSYDKFINPNDLQEMLLSEGIQVVARR